MRTLDEDPTEDIEAGDGAAPSRICGLMFRWSPLVGVFAELFFPISIQVARRRQSL
jgi:hypothetical protein